MNEEHYESNADLNISEVNRACEKFLRERDPNYKKMKESYMDQLQARKEKKQRKQPHYV